MVPSVVNHVQTKNAAASVHAAFFVAGLPTGKYQVTTLTTFEHPAVSQTL